MDKMCINTRKREDDPRRITPFCHSDCQHDTDISYSDNRVTAIEYIFYISNHDFEVNNDLYSVLASFQRTLKSHYFLS